ncbi:lipopolysaccharide biosynthesis protein [Rosistilla oblonga]|uniref:lipopolysaccharide biosynthesis protein n=1 Tax=Rosistilla oblonga TaxID=2527990 RepID=UPI0018D256C3|nr:oligosaccharide flippase family protein [Rosistilla oblonga]
MKRLKTAGERRVASVMIGLVICTVVSQTCAAATFLLFANSLGTADFGKLSGAMFFQQFFSTLSVSGFRNVVIRELVKHPEQQNAITGSYLFLSGGIGLVMVFLLAIASLLVPIDSGERMAYLVISIGHVGACLIPNAIYDAKGQQVRGASIAACVDVIAVMLTSALFGLEMISVPIAASLVAGKWTLVAAASLTDLAVRNADFRPSFDWSQASSLWKSARMMSIATTLNVAPLSLGVSLTRILFGAGEAGLFAIAAFVLRSHVTVIGLLTRTVFPHVVSATGETPSFARRVFAAFGGVTLLVTTAAFACSEVALAFFLPSEYQASRITIAIVLLAGTVRVAGVVGNMYLVAQYSEQALVAIAIVGVAVFAIALVIPLPVCGRNQMALALLASSATMAVNLLYRQRDSRFS